MGGRAATRQSSLQPVDLGAQYLNSIYQEAFDLCKELNIAEKWHEIQPQTHHIYFNDELHCASYSSALDLFKLSYLSPISKVRLFPFLWRLNQLSRGTSFFSLEAPPRLDETSAYVFAERWGGEELAGRVLDAFVAAYHFHDASEMSLAFFAAMAGVWKGSFTYDITSQGIDQLAQALASRLTVKTNCLVESVEGSLVVTDEGVYLFDAVVVATTAPAARRLIRDESINDFLDDVQVCLHHPRSLFLSC